MVLEWSQIAHNLKSFQAWSANLEAATATDHALLDCMYDGCRKQGVAGGRAAAAFPDLLAS
eukprot:scaffold274555_cov18-Tisochrysis_lutea.AAC.1